jgi:alginate O-acetyltransferase complex protein AlgI
VLFNSHLFLFLFLPLVVAGVWTLAALEWRNAAKIYLIGASLVFYGWWNPRAVLLLLALVGFNYFATRTLIRLRGVSSVRLRTGALVMALAVNVAILGYFKYANFIVALFEQLGRRDLRWSNVALPLGISFITFQKVALLIDAHNGAVTRFAFLDYCLFVTFFPQLIAGPIVHHKEVIPQFEKPGSLRFSSRSVALGLTMLSIGLFKKVMIADRLAQYVSPTFYLAGSGTPVDGVSSWAAAISYTLQLYFDFSGYCDMAVGLALFFSIKLPFNFDSPFKATSIIDFWRRWHMTLTRFLTAYIYNPVLLAIARRRLARGKGVPLPRDFTPGTFAVLTAFPTILTMLVAGVWHGAGFQFAVFGLLHGVFLTVNHGWRLLHRHGGHQPSLASRLATNALTFVAVMVAFVFFRADSVTAGWSLVSSMAGGHGIGLSSLNAALPIRAMLNAVYVGLIVVAVWLLPSSQRFAGLVDEPAAPRWKPSFGWGVCLAAMALVAVLKASNSSEFLYFNF